MQKASKIYPSDLKDSEWQLLQPPLPAAAKHGRPRECGLRAILDGIFSPAALRLRLATAPQGFWPVAHGI